jgi:hypothetical protein
MAHMYPHAFTTYYKCIKKHGFTWSSTFFKAGNIISTWRNRVTDILTLSKFQKGQISNKRIYKNNGACICQL